MNQRALRELFEEFRGDIRDYFDAQRDALAAQSRMAERILDVYAELIPAEADPPREGAFAKGDGVDVVVPPPGTAHAFDASGRCVVHPGCQVRDPEAETPRPISKGESDGKEGA